MPTQAIDLGQRTILRLSGGDRQRYLNGQVSNDVRKLGGKNSIPACVTTLKGKLDALVQICETDDAYHIDSVPELRESLLARLDKYIIADDCELEDISDAWHIVHILGEFESSHATRSSERFGQMGTDLWLPAGDAIPDGLEILAITAVEALRIRNAVPKWGIELTPATLPAEAGLDTTAIDFNKGCYIGQEVISRIKSVGRVNRKLVRLRCIDDAPVELTPGQPLFDGEKEVGKLTSIAAPDALAYVKRDHNAIGTRLTTRIPADPQNEKKFLSTSLEIVDSRNA